MDKVGITYCPIEKGELPSMFVDSLKREIERISSEVDYLEFFDLKIQDCKKLKKDELEKVNEKYKKLILLVSDPYSDKASMLVEKFRVVGFETHMIKVLNVNLFSNGDQLDSNRLETYLRYWGTYMASLSRRKLTLTVSKFKSKMSRRDLLGLLKRGFLERRFLPTISEEACVLDRGCRKCIDYCPVDALKPIDIKSRKIEVYETKCVGCGICESVCPTNAIEVHGTSNEVLAKSVGELLEHREEPTIIATCNVKLSKIVQKEALDILKEENVFNLELDCVGRMDPITSLYFLGAGAKGIVLIDCEGDCPYRIKNPLIKENYDFTAKLLDSFKQSRDRIKLVSTKNGELKQALKKAVDEMKSIQVNHRKGKIRVFEKGENKFKRAIFDFKELVGITPEGMFESDLYGPSIINIDEIKCTMCKACVLACPTYAFHMKEEGDSINLNFILANCISCGYCVEVCPENALSIDYHFDLREVAEAPIRLMKKDEIAKCRHCGTPIGPLSTLKKVERLLKLRWDGSPKVIESVYYCEKCKKLRALGMID